MALGFIMLASPVMVLGLPGSYGRYTEYFRHRGQLRTFLARTTCVTILLATTGVALLTLFAPQFARLVFGTSEVAHLMRLVAVCLAAATAFNVLDELLNSLRFSAMDRCFNFCRRRCLRCSA